MQAGGDYLDDARASGALGIQARVWQPLRLHRAGGVWKNLVGARPELMLLYIPASLTIEVEFA